MAEITRKDAVVRTGSAGHGNPAATLAVAEIIRQEGYTVDTVLQTIPVWMTDWVHRYMRRSVSRSIDYTRSSEDIRSKSLFVFGLLSLLEHRIAESIRGKTQYTHGFFIQEHQLGALQTLGLVEWFTRQFPGGRYLVIPDVYPKESAVRVMRETGIPGVVWNTYAQEELQQRGIEVFCVKPFLLPVRTGQEFSTADRNYIVVKPSGSGMPAQYISQILEILDALSVEYAMFLPDRVIRTGRRISSYGTTTMERMHTLYGSLQARPPAAVIAPPSEMVQLAGCLAECGTHLITLPPGGRHEARNAEYAIRTGLCVVDHTIGIQRRFRNWQLDAWDLKQAIRLALATPNSRATSESLRLGTSPLTVVAFRS